MTKITKINMAIGFLTVILLTVVSLILTTNTVESANTVMLRDGALITTPTTNKIYILKSDGNIIFRREILDQRVFNSYPHLSPRNVIMVDDYTFNKFTPSNLMIEVDRYGNSVDGKVYALSITVGSPVINKHHINITPYEFNMLGLQWGAIYQINRHEASLYRDGPAMNAQMVASHLILPGQAGHQPRQTTYTIPQGYTPSYGYPQQTQAPLQPTINYTIPAPTAYTQPTPTIYTTPAPQSTTNISPSGRTSVTIQENTGYATFNPQNNSVTIHEAPLGSPQTYSGNPYIGSVPRPGGYPQAQQTQQYLPQQQIAPAQQITSPTTQSTASPSRISTIPRVLPARYRTDNNISSINNRLATNPALNTLLFGTTNTSSSTTNNSQATGFYTSKSGNAKYYYPASCNGWRNIASSNRVWAESLPALQSKYNRTLHPSC